MCYRLTPEQYDAVLDHQGGVCAGCGKPPLGVRLAVDHCHKTGKIRGLLCWSCNKGLAFYRDRGPVMRRLADYLDSNPADAALGFEVFGLIGKSSLSKKVKVYGPPEGHSCTLPLSPLLPPPSPPSRPATSRRKRTTKPS